MEPTSYLRFVFTLFLILGLILLLGYLARRYGLPMLGGAMRRPGGRPRRLRVEETAIIDQRRRLVLVSRDGVEHLLVVGGGSDMVVEANITPPRFALPDEAPTPSSPSDDDGGTSQTGPERP